ncbi:hypothetical protein K503DRAFT_787089 [Rhizopogon vinicolor AM-OR11-026]|uniref:Uncharacterized protein n=1 Tax=Rhizopogon vinicolor AM-OR11-026 TaxID=1314800 RepID=A0A1B7MJ36_9AGAM|nr:hypothetical protein K503DRAFT_787089 [Rhizopogon vinicolor AM-OR11-026]
MILMAGNIQLIEAASMAAVDIVLRRSSRIAQHPQHPYTHIPKRRQQIDQDPDADDQLTPRALRALKRQRLTLDSDGLPLPQLESPHRRKRRKENDILTTGPLKEPTILAPKDDDQDAPTQTTPPHSPSPVPHYRPPSPVQMNPPPADLLSIHVTLHSPTDVIQSRSHSPPPLPQPQSEPNPPTQVQSNLQPSHSHPPPLHQLPDLDSLIPLDPLPEFLPHDAPYSDSPNFQSNASFSSVPVHEFPSTGDMNFVSNTHPFSSPQSSVFSSPGAFGSNHTFPSNPGSFPNSFGPHSHEFIPAHSHSDFSPPQDNSFSTTDGFPPPSSNGFTSPSNGFHPQSNDYTQSNGYSQSNGYTQQGAFSQPNHLTYDYTPVAHRDREVNIWKLACQERVEFLLHRYGIDTIKALVASQARIRYQSSPDDDFSSNHSSNTRFRLYTPASYIERASYTYKSAELDGMDFEMDDDDDYDDDDDDDEDCDFGCDVDDCGYDDEGDEEDMFPMDMELMESGKSKVVVVKGPGRDRDIPKRSESLETKTKTNSSMLPNPIVPPTVPPIPQSISMSSPSDSIPIPQIPEPGAGSGSPTVGVHSSTGVDSSPRTPSIPQPTSPPPSSTPPGSTPGTSSPPSIPHTPTSLSTPETSPPSSPTPTLTPPPQTPTVSTTQTSTTSTPQMPQTPTPAPGPPTLLRTPPLSSLHVTLLSEPPRAFMGRGTPPDRRRLSEWGRWGCIRAMGLRGDVQHSMAMATAMCGDSMALREDVQQQPGENVPLQHGERMAGDHTSTEHTSTGEAQQQHLEHREHLPAQHVETQHDEDSHPPPQHEHDHSEHLETHGEWTSFLFAMLEGDAAGNSAGWYELGAGVSASPSVSVPGEPAVGMETLGSPQGMTALNIPQSMSVPQTVGEADSTLRFALG